MEIRHIAYYNDVECLKNFSECTADEIIENYKKGLGHIYTPSVPMEYDTNDFEEGIIKFSTDKKFAVLMDLPNDINLLGKPYVCDFFIDIFEVIK